MSENTNLRQQIHQLNRDFDFTEFFSYDGNKDHGATGLITPSQAVTRPNVDDYSGHHITTTEQIIQAIYDLPDKEKQKELPRLYINIIKQSIKISLVNEHSLKLIVIEFPPQITEEQLNLLIAYQNTYGHIVKQFSEPYENENQQKIVFFQKHNGIESSCHSFEEAVQYAQTLPIIKTPKILDQFIIGSIVSPDKTTLHCPDLSISLQDHSIHALDNGLTSEECHLASRHQKSIEPQRPDVTIHE